ncbi:uncharacterized protein EAE97_011913 [Botrytis byssoidea]|uniref:Uncharacterized protein n=1 Tax=Botrytis byssoidea TaxID=139641 RepID=A0A9P5LG76_9HELO|nr:uncharacterized protein EAE97_011913 [Botrytis byssoidea]KAF7918142.1 hypothetical protein EAE97_011913 [Botrytis byssoidea]
MATISEISLPQIENILEGHTSEFNPFSFSRKKKGSSRYYPFRMLPRPSQHFVRDDGTRGRRMEPSVRLNETPGNLGHYQSLGSALWHLGCCILMFYFFSSILQISSTLIPQWIPTILDCGFRLSLGVQNLPTAYLYGVRDWAMNMVGSLCGGDQPTFRRENTYTTSST